MSESTERAVTRALDPYAQALRELEPSAALDDRIGTTIEAWAEQSAGRGLLRRPLPWVVAAASVAVITGGIALLMSRDGPRADDPAAQRLTTAPAEASRPSELTYAMTRNGAANASGDGYTGATRMSPLAAGQVSLYPAESAIFRVKASFASAVSFPQQGDAQGERQYWVDVRIANDGTMRIVQVIPAERGRVVPRE
jgi:hypothetical protein